MDFSKFSNQDLLALKNNDYSKLSTGALIYLKQNASPKGPDLQQLQAEDRPVQPASVISDALKAGGQGTRALGTLAATGGDLQQASNVAQGQPANTMAGKVGSIAGDLVSPAAIGTTALTAGVGEALSPLAKAALAKGGQIVNTLKAPTMEEAKALGQTAEAAFQPETTQKATQYAKQLVDPVKQEIQTIGQRLANLPGETADKMKALQDMLSAHGKEMGAAENAGGFGFKSTPEFEQAVSNPETMQKALKTAGNFVKAGPQKVAETVDPQTIQMVRKLAQEGGNGVSNLGNATLQQGREVAGQALGIIDKRFGQARQQYQEVSDAIKDLPQDAGRMKSMLRSQLQAAKTKLADAQSQTKDLMEAAKSADAEQFADIKQKSMDLLRQGIEHDQMIRRIKETAVAIGGAGAAALGIKRYKG